MILFALREGWRNFHNLGLIGLLTLFSMTLTLTLSGLAIGGYILIEDWTEGLLGRFEIEVFLSPDADSLAASGVMAKVNSLPLVRNVKFISKEDAASRFTEQFGGDIFDLLEYNPLPTSIVVSLDKGADPATSWGEVADAIKHMNLVEDVVYEGELLSKVDQFYHRTGTGILSLMALTLIVSLTFTVLMVFGAIRSREDFIRIILLCGGSHIMARGPFISLGAYYGLVAGCFATGILMLFFKLGQLGWGISINLPTWWIAAQTGAGMLLGMIGAGWAAGRRIRET